MPEIREAVKPLCTTDFKEYEVSHSLCGELASDSWQMQGLACLVFGVRHRPLR